MISCASCARAAAALVFVAAASACDGAPDLPATARTHLAWRPIGTWSGRGHKQTESFTSDTGTLRAQWETTRPDPGGVFRLTIHSAISGRPLERIVEHAGSGMGTAYLYEDPRVFHAVVDSSGVDWTFTIEEGVVGTVNPMGSPAEHR